MPFKFTLQPVLQQRVATEEKRQREYGDAQAKVESARERRRCVVEDISRWGDVVRRTQGAMDYARRELIERWITAQEERIELLDAEIEMLAAQAEQCRLRLVKAVQDRTMMEKLREREHADWRIEEDRAERRFFDEIAVRDFIDQKNQEKDAGLEERIAG